jgi:hypothetical protein
MEPRRNLQQHGAIALSLISLVVLGAAPAVSRAAVPSLERPDWMWSSVPVERVVPGGSAIALVSSLVSDHARLEWYNPRPDGPTAVKESDLDPTRTGGEGGDNHLRVLEWSVGAPAGETALGPEDWTGLTQVLSQPGFDLSKSRFIEIWVNDFRHDHGATKAFLHVDLGRVSEDAFWSRTESPNNQLDTEDKNGDGRLDGGEPTSLNFEDTGFDGVVSALEPGYVPGTNPDPNGDDYRYNVQDAPDDYSTINNFELNGLASPSGRPDTEDLDRDFFLDTANDYFEASIDLSGAAHVAIDVAADYPGYVSVGPDNGWRLFRIPLSDEAFRAVGSPSWESVQHLRLWISDLAAPLTLQIGGIAIDGFPPPAPVDRIVLGQNHPNPFNPVTVIPYELGRAGRVRLAVYDVRGRFVRELVDAVESEGPHTASWSGVDSSGKAVASGVYVYRITAGGKSEARRMVLLR